MDLVESFQTSEKLYYIYEYCEGGELYDLISLLEKMTCSEMRFFV